MSGKCNLIFCSQSGCIISPINNTFYIAQLLCYTKYFYCTTIFTIVGNKILSNLQYSFSHTTVKKLHHLSPKRSNWITQHYRRSTAFNINQIKSEMPKIYGSKRTSFFLQISRIIISITEISFTSFAFLNCLFQFLYISTSPFITVYFNNGIFGESGLMSSWIGWIIHLLSKEPIILLIL